MIIVIGGEKGGTGKSTIATNLAVFAALVDLDCLLVDTDVQRSTDDWTALRDETKEMVNAGEGPDGRRLPDHLRRLEDVPTIRCVNLYGKIVDDLRDLEERYKLVLVDVGGRDSEELRSALVAADRLYSPIRPSQADLATAGQMVELVQLARSFNPDLQANWLLNQVSPHHLVTEDEDAKELLTEDLSLLDLSPVRIHIRKSYRDAFRDGLGVLELRNKKAKSEITHLGEEVFDGIV